MSETEIEELCVVDMPTEFQPLPDVEAGDEGSVRHLLNDEDIGLRLSDKFEAELFLRGVGVSGGAGIENFDFMTGMRVEVASGNEEPVELLYAENAESKGNAWYVESDSNIDIARHLLAEDLALAVEFAGTLPQTVWTANLEVCVSAEASYRESVR